MIQHSTYTRLNFPVPVVELEAGLMCKVPSIPADLMVVGFSAVATAACLLGKAVAGLVAVEVDPGRNGPVLL